MTNAEYVSSFALRILSKGATTPSTCCCVSMPGGPSFSVTQSIAGPPSMRSGAHASSMPRVTASVELGLMTSIFFISMHCDLAVLEAREQAHHRPQADEIDDTRGDDRRGVVGDRLRLARGIQQLGKRDHAGDRGELHYLERVGDQVRNHVAGGLRHDDVGERLRRAEAGGAGGFELRPRDGVDAGAEYLAVIARGIEQE